MAKADIQWWTCLLHEWNGRSFFPCSAPSVHVYSDASWSFLWLWCLSGWRQLVPASVARVMAWRERSIATLELIPIVIAAALWGPQWHSQVVLFHSDNVAVVCDINRMFSSNSSLIHLLRCLSFYAAYFGFHFKAEHVPGVKNSAADALSCNNVHLFLSLVPQVLARSPSHFSCRSFWCSGFLIGAHQTGPFCSGVACQWRCPLHLVFLRVRLETLLNLL